MTYGRSLPTSGLQPGRPGRVTRDVPTTIADHDLEWYRERILLRSIPEPNSGCWLWLAELNQRGYGRLGTRKLKPRILAHRASWMVHNGPIPVGLNVLHKCDVISCVNPDHLFLGTHQDNVIDMHRKGRANPAFQSQRLLRAEVA